MIIQNSIKKAREIKINPIMVVVLDHRGAIKACLGEDGIVVYALRLLTVKQMELSKWVWDQEHYLIGLNSKLISLML